MKVIWIRHGVTSLNKKGVYLGQTDPSLDEDGLTQATYIADHIARQFTVDAIYSSDLRRTLQTAFEIGRQSSCQININSLLRELNFGEWDGLTYEQVKQKDFKRLEKWYENPKFISPPSGETLLDLGKRIDTFIMDRIIKSEQKICVIVSHGGPIRWFISKWVLQNSDDFWNTPAVGHGEMVVTRKVNEERFEIL